MSTQSDDTGTKRCSRCHAVKPLDAFSRHGQSKDGRFSYCRACFALYQQSRFAKNGITRTPRRPAVEGKKWCPDCDDHRAVAEFGKNRSTKDGLTAYCSTHQQERVRASRERVHGSSRHYHLVRRYGISAADVDHMIEQQRGLCAICRRELDAKAHVDHDHSTKSVRAVLCFNCNGGLGQFGDHAERLRAAAAYVEQHRGVDAPRPPEITLSVEQVGIAIYYTFTHGVRNEVGARQ